MNLPTALTWARVVIVPLIVGIYYLPDETAEPALRNVVGSALFVLAALTDWLDGYLARSLGQTSRFGAFLDPVADKLIVAAALIILVQLDRIEAVLAIIIIGREIAISALREWMAELGARSHVAVSVAGKIKTVAQMVAIPLLLYDGRLAGIPTRPPGVLLAWLAAALTIWSMLYYLKKAWPALSARA